MKYFYLLLFSVLFSPLSFATNLCDSSCEIVIKFPDGGSIQAIEALTIEFGLGGELELGETGTVNTNPQPISTDFSSGGSLSLAEGDSITFASDGWLKVSGGGNIDYTSILINSSGDCSVTAVDEARTISIENVTMTGAGHVFFDAATISVNGNLTVESGGTISFVADTTAVDASVCSVQDVDNNVTLSTGTVIDTLNSCSILSTELNVSSGLITEGSFASLELNLETIIIGGTFTFDPGTLEPITQELLESFDDGISLSTEDGNTCTMLNGECISTTGQKYVVVDGQLVAENSGSGLMNPFIFLLLFGSLLLFKQSKVLA